MVYERFAGPLGPERLDYLFASLQAQTYNANRKKGSKAATAADFAPPWSDRKAWPWSTSADEGPQTPEDQLKAIKQMMGQR
jgi:hypothetical protein